MSPKDMDMQYAPVPPQHSVQANAVQSQPQVTVIHKPSAGGTKSCCWVAGLVLLSVVFLTVCLVNIATPLVLNHGPVGEDILDEEWDEPDKEHILDKEWEASSIDIMIIAYVASRACVSLLIVGTSLMAARWATTSRTTCLRVMYIFAGSIVVSLLVAAAVTLARYSRGNHNDMFNLNIVDFWKYEGGVCAVLLSVLALLIAIRWAMRDARAVPEPYSLELDDATSTA